MNAPYGPIKKSPLSILFFLVPAVAIVAIALWLTMQDAKSLGSALGSPVVLICAALAIAALVWGGFFVVRPIVTLTENAIEWPDGRTLAWGAITKLEAGQFKANAPSGDSTSATVHEVMRVYHGDDMHKIVTTWAAIGPQAANDRIMAAFNAKQAH